MLQFSMHVWFKETTTYGAFLTNNYQDDFLYLYMVSFTDTNSVKLKFDLNMSNTVNMAIPQ